MCALDTILAPQALDRLRLLLEGVRHIGIFCHARPDGDAIGSSLALSNILTAQGYIVMCVAPNLAPEHVIWPAGHDRLYTYEVEGFDVRTFLPTCDLFFFLDLNNLQRLDESLMSLVESLPQPRVMIDHHPYPANDFDLLFSMPEASSTCELLTELVLRFWGEEVITPRVATPLYMGLMTDTGSFSYSCSRGRTFEIAGLLVDHGVDVAEVQERVYNSRSLESLMLQSFLLLRKTNFFVNGRVALIKLSQSIQNEYNYQPGDSEGLVNLPLSIAGVEISILLSERANGTVRISVRSTRAHTINGLMTRYFNGGGHPQASGGTLRLPMYQAINFTQEIFERFLTSSETVL